MTIRTHEHLDTDQAAHLAALWTATYPAMREILDLVIRANRATDHPVVDVPRLVRVRRELGQIDRGTYRPCTYSGPAFSPHAAYSLIRAVLDATPLGSPHAAGIHRLAAQLADLTAAMTDRPVSARPHRKAS